MMSTVLREKLGRPAVRRLAAISRARLNVLEDLESLVTLSQHRRVSSLVNAQGRLIAQEEQRLLRLALKTVRGSDDQ